jgi:hypothetical protein
MKKKLFAELVESIREAGKIHRGEERPAPRIVISPDDERLTFPDLAGAVRVSPEKKGVSWPAIKAGTWRRRATARK